MKKSILDQYKKNLNIIREELTESNESQKDDVLNEAAQAISLLEYQVYKRIPKTSNYYRLDNGKINKSTLKHAAVYANSEGKGKELYAVNIDGSGHDGSSGKEIPKRHADHFRNIGFTIADNNILENLYLNSDELFEYEIKILLD